MIASPVTEPASRDDPTYRMKLAAELEKAIGLQAVDSGRVYFRLLVGPEALHAITRALRGI